MSDPTNPPTPAEIVSKLHRAYDALPDVPEGGPRPEAKEFAALLFEHFPLLLNLAEQGIAPPVAAPSGEAAPREAGEVVVSRTVAMNCRWCGFPPKIREVRKGVHEIEHGCNFKTRRHRLPNAIEEWNRFHTDGREIQRLTESIRTLSDGKAAAEALYEKALSMIAAEKSHREAAEARAKLEKAARESETQRAEMERGFKEAQIEGHKYTASKLAASESRVRELEGRIAELTQRDPSWYDASPADAFALLAQANRRALNYDAALTEAAELCRVVISWSDCEAMMSEVMDQIRRYEASIPALSGSPVAPAPEAAGMPECVETLVWHHRALIADLRQAFPEGKHIGPCDSYGACMVCTDLHDKEVDDYTNAVESYYAKPSATAGEGGE